MSLASVYDACAAGCVSTPQHGYVGIEPPNRYSVTIGSGVNRPYFQFNELVTLDFNCTSPPAKFTFDVYERPVGESATDPIFHLDSFLLTCDSPGFALNTSRWFRVLFVSCHFFGAVSFTTDWIHINNLHSPLGSIGLIRAGIPLP